MNLRPDTWLAGVLIFLSCTSVVRTQEPIPGASDIGLFTGFSSIASFGLGALLGFFVKHCPACSDPTPSLTCPDSFTASTVGDETWCYRFLSNEKNREEASLDCAAMAPKNANGRLLGIETEEEREAFSNFIGDIDLPSTLLWLDSSDYDGDGTYIWNRNGAIVQNVMDFVDGTCAFVTATELAFFTEDCSLMYIYICESIVGNYGIL